MGETKILADWISGLRFEDIPDAVREHARRFLLDNIGCQLGGAPLPWSRSYYDVLGRTRSGTHSTVAYFGTKLPPDEAAFLNSAFNHANEADDTHLKSPTHAGNIAVPVSVAMGEFAKTDGKRLMLAIIAAYEMQIRVSWASSPHLLYRGHHPPAGVGPFGAAAASAVQLGLNPEKTLNAIAIAGSHSAGLMEFTKTGGSVKRIHSSIAAAGGVRAALFADAGITGPRSILEGEKGFFNVFAGEYDLSRLTAGLGEKYHLLDNAIKVHSCCHHIHVAFDALDKVREREPIGPDQVKSMVVFTNSKHILGNIGTIREPDDVLGAQFSLPFSMAMRLHHSGKGLHGGNGFWDYVNIDLKDPKLLETASRVTCAVAPTEWTGVDKGAGMEIELMDGRRIKELVTYPRGVPENPLTPAEVKEKFHSIVDPVLPPGRAQQIIDAVDRVEEMKSVAELSALLVVQV